MNKVNLTGKLISKSAPDVKCHSISIEGPFEDYKGIQYYRVVLETVPDSDGCISVSKLTTRHFSEKEHSLIFAKAQLCMEEEKPLRLRLEQRLYEMSHTRTVETSPSSTTEDNVFFTLAFADELPYTPLYTEIEMQTLEEIYKNSIERSQP